MKEEEYERCERMFELIGFGKFHVLYNIFFACLGTMVTSCSYYAIYWVLVIPEHWCKVPMPVDANYTIEEWRNLTIPRSNESSLQEFESCKMYEYDLGNISYENTTGCKYGWDYDTTWYTRTAPSQEDWVCEREVLVTDALAAFSIGESIGILLFGYIGDRLGRKTALLLTSTTLLIGRTLSLLFPNIYWLFYVGIIIGNLSSEMVTVTFMLIGMEINDARHRPLVDVFYLLGECSGHLLSTGLLVCLLIILYGVLSLNVWYVGGNPFLVFFFQAAAKIPGNITSNYLCNRIGRRTTLLIMFPILMVIAIGMSFLTTSHAEVLPYLSIASGFFTFAAWEAVIVQTVEILPASFSSRGFSVCLFGVNLTNMSVPYILLLGKNVDVRLPYIISAAAMALAILVCALSPETLKKKRR